MTSARRSRRRRNRWIRFVARLAPVLAVALVAAAIALNGRWPVVAASSAAALTILVSAFVFRLDRRWRLELAAVRARLAADHAAEQARYATEHRSFTAHMSGMLDAALNRIGLLRYRVDWLESQLAAERSAPANLPEPGVDLARFVDRSEWTELWPDLAEAPTVVDLVGWDERVRDELRSSANDDDTLLPQPLDDTDEGPQQRTA